MKTLFAVSAVFWTCAASAADFVNLRFDEPDVSRLKRNPSTGLFIGPVGDLLRGWEVSIRPPWGQWISVLEEIEFGHSGGAAPPIGLDRGMHGDMTNLSVVFNSRFVIGGSPHPEPPAVRLSTKGMVPLDARFFEWDQGSALEVMVSDGSRQVAALGNTGILNVSQFAGKMVTIQFELGSGGYDKLDVIGFTQTAREPTISPPSKLTHTSSGKESVTLTWAPSTEGVLGYELFSSPNLETPFTNRINSELITDISYTHSSPDATGRYYQVRAVGMSSRSGTAVTMYSIGVTRHVP